MIEVTSSQKFDATVSRVEVDEYVPIRFRSYEGTIGARYIRFGDFQTSLLEFILRAHPEITAMIDMENNHALSEL